MEDKDIDWDEFGKGFGTKIPSESIVDKIEAVAPIEEFIINIKINGTIYTVKGGTVEDIAKKINMVMEKYNLGYKATIIDGKE